jgi:hypothetical protein
MLLRLGFQYVNTFAKARLRVRIAIKRDKLGYVLPPEGS